MALSPNEPKERAMPRVSGCAASLTEFMRMVNHLRCLTFLGNIMIVYLFGLGVFLVFLEDLALVDPDLDADVAIGHVGLLAGKIDVGAQSLERDAAALHL